MTSKAVRRTFSAALTMALSGSAVALFIACRLADVDFEGKSCPCGAGYVCDTARNVCVQGSVVPLTDGGGTPEAAADSTVVIPDAGCTGETCACNVDDDCKADQRRHCGPSKICVECVASPDSCPAGSYCNSANQCVLGCKQESDCQISPAAPHCATDRHQCVACRDLGDCTGADRCSPSGECVQGCDLDAGKLCSTGKECCDGLCIDLKKDPLNCGKCGQACSTVNGTPTCDNTFCNWSCAAGFSHCAAGNTGCETNVRSDPQHCGACTTDCSPLVVNVNSVLCAVGSCGYDACKPNFYDCDGKADSGCECPCGGQGQTCCPGRVCSVGTCKGNNKCM